MSTNEDMKDIKVLAYNIHESFLPIFQKAKKNKGVCINDIVVLSHKMFLFGFGSGHALNIKGLFALRDFVLTRACITDREKRCNLDMDSFNAEQLGWLNTISVLDAVIETLKLRQKDG